MRIQCPFCGDRGNEEFSYLGDASVVRPDASAPNANDAFYEFAYQRRNVAGPTQELWYHSAGCHAWLVVTRDTRTHEILDVKAAQDVTLERHNTQGSAP
ncbi:MAG: sarcosine oxidase subunit delta [Hyphomicrobium sp.]|uniref:sarcosine oxidase subunit delta n=1 Tax=Hyphomicrobium sp. TaxID=82 RepID=UPI0039E6FB8C